MSETVLLVGGGGREHAIARALADDCTLYACASNRNPGIADLAAGFEPVDERDADAIRDYAESVGATLAVIGPESALEAGVADALADAGVFPFGPDAEAARIETDKAYQRRFMRDNDVPGCPAFETFDDAATAAAYVEEVEGDVAVKPRGLTGGKGVRVSGDQLTKPETVEYVRESGYGAWVVEERLVGEEFTVQAFVANGEVRSTSGNRTQSGDGEVLGISSNRTQSGDGEVLGISSNRTQSGDGDVRPTPAVQDHKRAYEGDEGPNTGGMGSYSDAAFELPFMTEDDYDRAVEILEATVDALDGYTGVLYGQFMLTADGVKVVEFNARFGDPEAMNTLPVMETPFLDVLTAARDGDPLPELAFAPQATVCKYAVPAGYPTDPEGGVRVTVDPDSVGDALLFYASVDEREDGLYTTTSRSFAVVGVADTIEAAEAQASEALAAVGDGLRVREDVGTAALVQSRIDHVERLRE